MRRNEDACCGVLGFSPHAHEARDEARFPLTVRRLFILAALLPLLASSIARAEDPATATPTATPAPELPPEAPIDPRLEQPGETKATGGGFLTGPDAAFGKPRGPTRITHAQLAGLIAVPVGCVAIGGMTYTGLANQTGDLATPGFEMGAGYAGAWAGTAALAGGIWLVDHDAFTPAPNRAGFKDATWAIVGSAILAPVAAGAGTFAAGEFLEGRSRNPGEALAAAIGGAALGELLSGGSALVLKTPSTSGPIMLAFVPVGAGSALAYRVARGRFGREKALVHAPLVVLSARF